MRRRSTTPGIGAEYQPGYVPSGSILDLPAAEAPIDHVVVLMMENRSFDHYLGWLAATRTTSSRACSRYGADFRVDAPDGPDATPTPTAPSSTPSTCRRDPMPNPCRGCGYHDPGHGWNAGRAQRDGGFLGRGQRQRRVRARLLRGRRPAVPLPHRATLHHLRPLPLLAARPDLAEPRVPARRTVGRLQGQLHPDQAELGFQWDTIWDRLAPAQRAGRLLLLATCRASRSGARAWVRSCAPIDQYFADASAGTLPSVVVPRPAVPAVVAGRRPSARRLRAGQRFLRDVFQAFAESPHWERGLFVLTYDEWGGFFDHVAPPRAARRPRRRDDEDNFGQAGFRVPTIMASPYARPGLRRPPLYDHTSIMRFLEWRFLGAPPEGPGAGATPGGSPTATGTPTTSARRSVRRDPDPGLFDLDDLPMRAPTAQCDGSPQLTHPASQPQRTDGVLPPTTTTSLPAAVSAEELAVGGPGQDLIAALETGYFERVGIDTTPSEMAGTWVEGS